MDAVRAEGDTTPNIEALRHLVREGKPSPAAKASQLMVRLHSMNPDEGSLGLLTVGDGVGGYQAVEPIPSSTIPPFLKGAVGATIAWDWEFANWNAFGSEGSRRLYDAFERGLLKNPSIVRFATGNLEESWIDEVYAYRIFYRSLPDFVRLFLEVNPVEGDGARIQSTLEALLDTSEPYGAAFTDEQSERPAAPTDLPPDFRSRIRRGPQGGIYCIACTLAIRGANPGSPNVVEAHQLLMRELGPRGLFRVLPLKR